MAREFKAFVRAKRSRHPSNSYAWSFYTAAWISRFGKPPPTSPCCMNRLQTRPLRSAWLPVGHGCRRCWRKCSIPMLSLRSQPPGVSLSSTAVTSKALEPRKPSIACTSVWTWSSYSFVSITLTDQHTGESLVHFPLGPGDIALADRGYAYATPIVESVQKQADVILRMSPAHLPVYGSDGQRRTSCRYCAPSRGKPATPSTSTRRHPPARGGARLYPRLSSVRGTSQCDQTAPPCAESEERAHAQRHNALLGRLGPRLHHRGPLPPPC